MRSTFLFIILFFLSLSNAFAQTDKVLMTIGDETVSLQEFERIYNKNNVAGITEKQPVDEYLDLFINFKLKVLEAEKLGMDTAASFISELKGYRDQLAKPYLSDSATQEFLMRQEYERMKIELHVSHILLKIDPKSTPADTLLAYNKLMDIRKRALNGESFEALARANSEDPSVKNNGGDVGWMTAFRTIWEFENAIYNTPVKQISLPIRTQYGYHLAKVTEQRASRGTVHVAHIYVRAPADMDPEGKKQAEIKINAVYDSLKLGIDFAVLAKNNSEDRSSAIRGGEVPSFGAGQMIPEFEEAAFSLKKSGEISKPINSFYGWHIIKLIESKGLGTYEELKPEMISKLSEGPISAVKKRIYINKLKTEYNYTLNKQNFETLIVLVDTSAFSGKWSDSLLRNNKNVLFSIGTKNYSIADFGKYLKTNQRKSAPYSLPVFLNDQLTNFSDFEVQEYEKDMLVYKYPEFRYIIQEYHDGILLFDLTDKMVWSKAVQDTIGLENYYNENKAKYVWEKRAEVMIFSGDSVELINEAKALAVKYGKKKKFNSDFVLSKICKDDSVKNCIEIKEARFEKGDNQEVDKTNWVIGAGENYKSENLTSFVFVRRILEPEIKKLSEARGIVTADYQNHLEKAWIAELRAKYPVKVDHELLKTIK